MTAYVTLLQYLPLTAPTQQDLLSASLIPPRNLRTGFRAMLTAPSCFAGGCPGVAIIPPSQRGTAIESKPDTRPAPLSSHRIPPPTPPEKLMSKQRALCNAQTLPENQVWPPQASSAHSMMWSCRHLPEAWAHQGS